jgi:TM2 domain-containing membrane protein YozV
VGKVLSTRAQRKHELKLAKLQVQATAQQPAGATSPQYVQAPTPAINITNVNTNVIAVGDTASVKRWSRLVAFLLSCFIPGLGQMYKGHIIRGVLWFLFTAAGYVLFIVPGLVLHILCALSAAMGDTYC